MTSKVYVDFVTPVDAASLNDFNTATYVTTPANTAAIGVETAARIAADALLAPITSAALVTPNIGVASGTSLGLTSTLSATQVTSTVATGTPPLVVASTTLVANLHAATAELATTATTATTATNLSGGSFSVHKNGVAQSMSGGIYTLVTWGSERFDTNNTFSANRFTPQVAGKYLLTATIYVLLTTDTTSYIIYIYKNGVAYAKNQLTARGAASASLNISAICDANGSTDYFEIYAYFGDSPDIGGLSTDSFFSGTRV